MAIKTVAKRRVGRPSMFDNMSKKEFKHFQTVAAKGVSALMDEYQVSRGTAYRWMRQRVA